VKAAGNLSIAWLQRSSTISRSQSQRESHATFQKYTGEHSASGTVLGGLREGVGGGQWGEDAVFSRHQSFGDGWALLAAQRGRRRFCQPRIVRMLAARIATWVIRITAKDMVSMPANGILGNHERPRRREETFRTRQITLGVGCIRWPAARGALYLGNVGAPDWALCGPNR